MPDRQKLQVAVDYQLVSLSSEVEYVVEVECSVQAGIVFTMTTHRCHK